MSGTKYLVAVSILVAASLACGQIVSTPTPTAATGTPAVSLPSPVPTASAVPPTATEEGVQTARVRQYSVNVHELADAASAVTGWVYADDVVTVLECDGDWCKIAEPPGWVYRGCLTGYEEGRGCEAR
jgi:hypothetical protein